jgi:isocitrate/isopropylmalate dehydrogenase
VRALSEVWDLHLRVTLEGCASDVIEEALAVVTNAFCQDASIFEAVHGSAPDIAGEYTCKFKRSPDLT